MRSRLLRLKQQQANDRCHGDDSNLSPGMEKYNRKLFSALGMSDKWADILSGTTRMAFLFGRKLKDSGLEATLGGDAEGGSESRMYQFYKGGVFRSNKTTYSKTDEGVEAYLDNAVTVTREALRAVADSLGAPTAALDTFAISVKESFKGLSDEEVNKKLAEIVSRYAEGVSDAFLDGFEKSDVAGWAQRIAAGAGTAAERLQAIAEFPAKMLEAFGTSRDALVQTFAEGLATGNATAAGQSVADTLVASIQNALLTNAAGQIFDIVNMGIVTPMLDAITTGASVADALSQATIDATIKRAKEQAAVLAELFGNAEFAAAMEQLRTAVGGALGQAGGYLQTIPQTLSVIAPTDTGTTAADPLQKYYDDRKSLEIELATVMGDTGKAYDLITAGMGAAEKAAYDFNEGLRTQIRYQTSLNTLREESATLGIDLLRAQGREEEALAMERAEAIKDMDAYQVGLYDANTGTRALIDSLQRMKEISEQLASELPGVVSKFLTPEQNTANSYGAIAGDLIKAGLSGMGAEELTRALTGASKEEIAQAATAIYNMTGVTDEMRLSLVRAVGGLADLKDAANELAKSKAVEATDAAMAALEKAVAAQRKILEDSIKNIRAVFEAVRDGAKALYGEVDSTRNGAAAAGKSFISRALADALATGKLPDADALKEALADARSGIGATQYATQFEADKARLVLAGELSQLQAISGEQLTEAEKQLQTLDDILANAKLQLDELRGINIGVLSVEAALAAFTAAMGREKAAGGGGGGGGGGRGSKPVDTVAEILNGSNGAQVDLRSGIGYQSGTGLPYMVDDIRSMAADLLNSGNGTAVYDAIKSQGFTLAQANSILGIPAGEAEAWARAMGLPITTAVLTTFHVQVLRCCSRGRKLFLQVPTKEQLKVFR